MANNLPTHSNLAALIGDPNFPRIITAASQGERIDRLQHLYKTYSGLRFAWPHDRAVAIDGIQSRLLKAFDAQGGYGIADGGERNNGLLQGMLLWYRPYYTPSLMRITFPPDSSDPPSWSWMAYTGAIDFLFLGFGEMEWAEIQSPWSIGDANRYLFTADGKRKALWGPLRYISDMAQAAKEGTLYYDTPNEEPVGGYAGVQCIVVGIQRDAKKRADQRHYVILVRPEKYMQFHESPALEMICERVGAGYLPGRLISEATEYVQIH